MLLEYGDGGELNAYYRDTMRVCNQPIIHTSVFLF